jgi:hypothetical protein
MCGIQTSPVTHRRLLNGPPMSHAAKGHGQRHRLRVLVIVIAACTAATSGCGSSPHSRNTASSTRAQTARIRFAVCMRSHGVPNLPDPAPNGSIPIAPNSGINPQSPAFQAAQTACADLVPSPDGRTGVANRRLVMLRLAECMRDHGLPSFPDPTATPPSTTSAGGGTQFGTPGAFLSVPQTLIQSPAFKRAALDCHLPGQGTG